MQWLPGAGRKERYNVMVPKNWPSGSTVLQIKIIEEAAERIKTIGLGMKGKTNEGFYPLGHFSVQPAMRKKRFRP
jgi:hypothetical protein